MTGKTGWIVRRAAVALTSLASIATGTPALAATELVVLERTGKWNVRFNEESCNVMAEFGQEESKIALQMLFYGLGPGFELRVFGKPFRSHKPWQPITTDFGPVANPVTSTGAFGSAGGWPMAIIGDRRLDDFQRTAESVVDPSSVADQPITAEQERAVTWLDVRAKGGKTHRLQTGPMDKVMDVIRACQSDMIRSWGYEPDTFATMVRNAVPSGDPGRWLRPQDYPEPEVFRNTSARVRFRLDLSETGAVTACHVQEPMNPASMNELTCRLLMQRARFAPALDREGKPVKSLYASLARWIMMP